MMSKRNDTTMLDALLAAGGTELRDQLVVDLQKFESDLRTYCLSGEVNSAQPDRHAETLLHNLRGLAATIGAESLAATCSEAENSIRSQQRETLLQNTLAVVAEIGRVLEFIRRCPVTAK